MRVVTLLVAFALPVSSAFAHAFLKTSTPAVGSTVSHAPAQVVIDFTEGVEPRFSTITVQNEAGEAMQTGTPALQDGDTHLAVSVRPLPPGLYKVVWHATATDTHKTEGSFTFTIAK